MSKMLKLLHKAQAIKDDGHMMAILGSGAAVHPTNDIRQEFFHTEYSSNHTEETSVPPDPMTGVLGGGNHFTMIITSLMTCLAMAAFVLSMVTFQHVRTKEENILSVMSHNKQNEKKLNEVQKSILNLQKQQGANWEAMSVELSEILDNMESTEISFQELETQEQLLKMMTDDLKVTDRLILDKIIALNGEVKEVKQQMIPFTSWENKASGEHKTKEL